MDAMNTILEMAERRPSRPYLQSDVVNKIGNETDEDESSDSSSQSESEITENGHGREFNRGGQCVDARESEVTIATTSRNEFGSIGLVDETNEQNIVRLDYNADINDFSKFLSHNWNKSETKVILSILSDSDCSSDRGNDAIEAPTVSIPNGPIQDARIAICKSLVKVASLTKAWIINGGLNKGVDQLIEVEVKRRRDNTDAVPQAVLGFSNLGFLEEMKNLQSELSGTNGHASESNPTELSANLHVDHTHFLLVNDGAKKSDCDESKLRELIEFASTRKEANGVQNEPGIPLVYILIGGSVNTLSVVACALRKKIPVIVAAGTGGAADIICGLPNRTTKDMPDIFDKLFHRLEEFLIPSRFPADEVDEVIDKIKGKTKRQPFHEIEKLLTKTNVHERGSQKFRNGVYKSEQTEANQLPTVIENPQNLAHTLHDGSIHSTNNTDFDTGNRMRVALVQMLVGNGTQQKNAEQVVDGLQSDVVNEMLTKLILVEANLSAIEKSKSKKDKEVQLLIIFDIKYKQDKDAVNNPKSEAITQTLNNIKCILANQKELPSYNLTDLRMKFDVKESKRKSLTSVIVEALEKADCKPCGLFMLAADWDNKKVFKQLLQKKWMNENDHEHVLKTLLKDDTKKYKLYIRLIVEHNSNSKWLTTSPGPLEKKFQDSNVCKNLLPKSKDQGRKINIRIGLTNKMLFFWYVEQQMHKTAMLFWKQGGDCLAMALDAYHMSKKRRKDLEDKEGYDAMNDQMHFFSNLALDLLKKCYASNRQNTHDLLVGKVEDLDHRTPLQIAVDANFKTFISEPAIDDLLNKIWVKDIEKYDERLYVPLLLSEVCPLLAPVLLRIRLPTDHTNTDKQNSATTQGYEFVRGYFPKVRSFIDTPLVKFSYGFISYIAYLTLISIVLLTDFWEIIHGWEIAHNIWTFILVIEEVKQALAEGKVYNNLWNFLDIGALLTYIVGFILRMVYDRDTKLALCPDCLDVARIIIAFSLLIFFFRTLQFLSIYETLGPKIFMIRFLVADLIGFLLILAVFVSAYGVVSNVILYRNQPLNAQLLMDVFYDSWWSVLQQFNRDDALGLNCENSLNKDRPITKEFCLYSAWTDEDYENCKKNRCPMDSWIVSVLLAFYALLTCIVMLNVLIAMFNATFTTINDKQKEVAKMERYRLIREYSSRSMIPPPLCAITYPYRIIENLFSLCKYVCKVGELSQTGNETRELSTNDQRNTDVEGRSSDSKPRLSKSPPKAFEKNLDSKVKEWEHVVVSKYCKEINGKKS